MTSVNESFDNFELTYRLTKVVYVNSGQHAYSEFEIDKNMAMFGRNNFGKTSSLAGLKLSLYPEVSFTNCKSKFHFTGKDGDYDKESSYRFYFPTSKSFIITEAVNQYGEFCQVLFRDRGEWRYGRFLVPCEYEVLRHLFWEGHGDESLGLHPDSLNLDFIRKELLKRDAVQLSDSNEIAQYLYAGHKHDPARARFTLFPMKDGASEKSVLAFKNVYELSFDIGQTDKTSLPKAIASIIDMNASRKEERLSADLADLRAEYDQIRKQRTELASIENKLDVYEQHKKTFGSYKKAVHGTSSTYHSLLNYISCRIGFLEDSAQKITPELDEKDNRFNDLNGINEGLRKELQTKTGEITALEKRRDLARSRYKEADELLKQYPGFLKEDVASILEDEVEETKESIERRSSIEQSEVSLSELLDARLKTEEEMEGVKGNIEKNSPTILDQFEKDEASLLLSILPIFSSLYQEISEDAKHAVLGLLKHVQFSQEDNVMTFDGQVLENIKLKAYDRAEQRSLLQMKYERGQDELVSLNTEIQSLQLIVAGKSDAAKEISGMKKEIKKMESQITLINAVQANKLAAEEMDIEIDGVEEDREKLQEKININEPEILNLNASISLMKGKVGVIQDDLKELKAKKSNIENNSHFIPQFDSSAPADIDVNEYSFDEYLNEANYLYRKIEGLRDVCRQESSQLMQIVDRESSDLYKVYEFEDLVTNFRKIDFCFSELPEKKKINDQEIVTHNSVVNSQMAELKTAKKEIERFVEDINRELSEHRVSNLDGVRISLTLNKQFESLLKDIERYDMYSSSLLEENFYDRLDSFRSSFFDTRTQILRVDSLIDSFSYEYKFSGSDTFVTESQSGGTTTTTSSLVLALLMKKICIQHASVGLPIIVDEIGALDSKNIATTVSAIEELGFAVFCATPDPKTSLEEAIRRWIYIGLHVCEEPINNKSIYVTLPNMIESLERASCET